METILLNNELKVSVPETFHILTQAERESMASMDQPPSWCIKDMNRHLTMAAFWRDASRIALFFVNEQDVIRQVEQAIAKPLQVYGYHLEEWLTQKIGDRTAAGYRYTYTVNEEHMTACSFVIKGRKTLYYFHVYSWPEMEKENRKIWQDLLEQAVWK